MTTRFERRFPSWTRVLACLAVCFAAGCGGTLQGAALRDGPGAASDLEGFASFVRATHPEPFRFIPEDAFDALVRVHAGELRTIAAPTELEVGRAFQRVVASLHDAHMAVAQPAFQPDSAGSLAYLPIVVEPIDGELYVDAAITDVPVGTVLTSIDGHAVAEILVALSELAVYDGVNETARQRVVARDFIPLYHLAFGTRDVYALGYRYPDGTEDVMLASGVTRDAVRALAGERQSSAMHGRAPWPSDPLPTRYDVDAATSVIRLPSFGMPDVATFETRLLEHVAALTTTARLVVDLRGNEGGNRAYGIALANHLTDVPYVQWQRTSVRILEIPRPYRARVAPLFGTSLDRLRVFPRTREAGVHVLEGDPLAVRMVPTAPRLPARLAILVDGLTNSAANELVLALRSARPDAIVVGEEVGGGCVGHVGELPVSYVSSVYGVTVAMSLIRIEHVAVPGCLDGHGLVPDIAVAYQRDDFTTGSDPVLAAALAAF